MTEPTLDPKDDPIDPIDPVDTAEEPSDEREVAHDAGAEDGDEESETEADLEHARS